MLSLPNRYTEFNKILHENTLILEEVNRLLFTAIIEKYAGGAALRDSNV